MPIEFSCTNKSVYSGYVVWLANLRDLSTQNMNSPFVVLGLVLFSLWNSVNSPI